MHRLQTLGTFTNSEHNVLGKRPLFFTAVFFLVGILLADFLHVKPAVALVAATLFVVLFICLRKYPYSKFLILIAVMYVAMGYFSLKMQGIDAQTYPSEKAVISGRVCDVGVSSSGRNVYKIENVRIDGEKIGGCVFLSTEDGEFVLDDLVTAGGMLRKPATKSYEFGFDDRLYCAANGVSLRLSAEFAVKTGRAKDIAAFFGGIRMHLAEKMDELFGEQAGIAKAMFLGIDWTIEEELLASYRISGISHVLCVSGLHVGIICSAVYALLGKFGAKRRVKYIVSTAFLLLYLSLVGFRISAVRSGVMFFLGMTGDFLGKRKDILTFLSAALLIILLVNPAQIYDAGFQLSFGAVFSIAVIAGTLGEFAVVKKSKLLQLLLTSAAAVVGTSLILANLNNSLNPLTVLFNIVAVPLAGIVVPAIALVTIIYGLFGAPFLFLGDTVRALIRLQDTIAELAQRFSPEIPLPAVYGVAILAGFACMFVISKYTIAKRIYKIIAFAALSSVVCFCYAAPRGPGGMHIDFVNFGYAEACVVVAESGNCVLIDAGTSMVEDYLDDYGYLPRAVFITGMRNRSTSGLESLASRYETMDVYTPSYDADYLGEVAVSMVENGFVYELDENTRILAKVNEKGKADYIVSYKDRTVLIYLAGAPTAQAYGDAEVVRFHSLTKGSDDFAKRTNANYVMIKETDEPRIGGIAPVCLETVGSVRICARAGETEVWGYYGSDGGRQFFKTTG